MRMVIICSVSRESKPQAAGQPVPTRPETAGRRLAVAVAAQLDSRTLFAGQREIVIAHDGQLYRLRITQRNKLILTK